MRTLILLATYLICYIPLLLFLAFTPYLTRRSESFGVSIPEDAYHEPEVKQIRINYRNRVLLGGLIVIALTMAISCWIQLPAAVNFIGIGIILLLLLMNLFYLQGHRRMKLLKAERNWSFNKPQMVVIDTGFRQKRMLVSSWWFSLDFLMIFATLALGFVFYDKLPEKLPLHFNIYGQADNWVKKSDKTILLAPVFQLLMTMLMIFVYWMIGRAKQQVEAAHPEQSLEQNRIFRYRWSAFIVFTSIAMTLLFGIVQFAGLIYNGTVITVISLIVSGIIIAWAVILSFTTGQGGSLVRIGHNRAGQAINRDDDQYWKLGIIYFSPDDPAVIVEKRFGIGWTCNFARPAAWVAIIALIIVLGIFIVIPKYLIK